MNLHEALRIPLPAHACSATCALCDDTSRCKLHFPGQKLVVVLVGIVGHGDVIVRCTGPNTSAGGHLQSGL